MMDDQALLRYSRQIMLPEVDIEGQEHLEKCSCSDCRCRWAWVSRGALLSGRWRGQNHDCRC